MNKKPFLPIFPLLSVGLGILALCLSWTALTRTNADAANGLEPATGQTEAGSVYERVLSKQELRCGYVTYPPYLDRNVETGKLEGPIYDLVEELGSTLNLKIIWAEETDFDKMIQSLEAGRFDAMCSLAWIDTKRVPYVEFSMPVMFNLLNAYVRSDETRFASLADLNVENVTFSALDGSPDLWIAQKRFTKAKIISGPSLGQISKVLLDVTTGKADVAMTDPAVVEKFLETNPGSLKRLGDKPVQVFPLAMLLPKGDLRLKTLIDTALQDMLNRGSLDDSLGRYPVIESSILRVALPYRGHDFP